MMKGFIVQQTQPLVEENLSNLTYASNEVANVSSVGRNDRGIIYTQHCFSGPPTQNTSQPAMRKRNLPCNPDTDAEVIALSPRSLLATNRFVCEMCGKGFQRDQNLQLHRRGHNLPWKLKQRSSKEAMRKKVYVCPEASCVHHDPSRALGDLTGIKKHFCRKHGEKKWKCDKCSKRYAVQSDCKAHSKTCGTREYRCDCGTLFSRRDSFISHGAFCDVRAKESAKAITRNPLLSSMGAANSSPSHVNIQFLQPQINFTHDQPLMFAALKKEQKIFTVRPPESFPWLVSPLAAAAHDMTPLFFPSCSSPEFQEIDDKKFPNPSLMGRTSALLPYHSPPAMPHHKARVSAESAAATASDGSQSLLQDMLTTSSLSSSSVATATAGFQESAHQEASGGMLTLFQDEDDNYLNKIHFDPLCFNDIIF